jgi:hypothetical protein
MAEGCIRVTDSALTKLAHLEPRVRCGSDFTQNLASADEAYPVSVNLVGKGKSGARSAYPRNSPLQTNLKTLDAKLHTELTAVRDDAFA